MVEWAQAHPVEWIQRMLHADLWGKQGEIARSVRDNRYTTVKACHAAGKTFPAAQIALWFLFSHYPSKVITTAPTNRQVYSLLWSEIRTAHARAERRGTPLGGEPLKTRFELGPDWFAEGFAVREYDQDRISGYHAPYLLVIVDEASGVPDMVFDALEGLMSTGHARMLSIGNPIRATGRFRDAFSMSTHNCISIPAWDTPNFDGLTREQVLEGRDLPDDSDLPRPYLITPRWVYERAQPGDWGVDSVQFRTRIDAGFPEGDQEADSVIPMSVLVNSKGIKFPEDTEPVQLGVDVARYGDDKSVIAVRHGRRAEKAIRMAKKDTMHLVGRVVSEAQSIGWDRVTTIRVDLVGMGAAPVDRMRELQREGIIPGHVDIVAVNVGQKSRNREYVRVRDEIWFGMRDLMSSGQVDVSGMSEEALEELAAPRFSMMSTGKKKVEPKDEIKRPNRLGRSPDEADAWILAFVDCPDETPRSRVRARSLGRRR